MSKDIVRYIVNTRGLPILQDMLHDLGATYNQDNVDTLLNIIKMAAEVSADHIHSKYNKLGAYINNGKLVTVAKRG